MPFEPFSPDFVAKLAAWDQDATHEFAVHFGRLIVIQLRRRRLSSPMIEDIRQDTLLRVLLAVRQGNLRDAEKLGPYVYSTCRHVASEYFRRNPRHADLEPDLAERPAREKNAENRLLDGERALQVRATLDELSERDGAILRALFLEDADKDHICSRFNVDRRYLRVLVHRAKASFREKFPPSA